jgi:hypothetical protein
MNRIWAPENVLHGELPFFSKPEDQAWYGIVSTELLAHHKSMYV